MIHIYTGNGKGKTTAAFGLAMRASGQGLKVAIFQFFKPAKLVCGEEVSAGKLKNIRVVKCRESHPMFGGQGKAKKAILELVKDAEKAISSKRYGMVILDEIINVVDQDFFSSKKFISLLKKSPKKLELVLTGRGDISRIEEYADYVTILVEKKHPFRTRIGARRGVEY